MKTWSRRRKIVAVLLSLPAVLAVVVAVRENRKFDAPYPAIHASNDPEIIARGRYLVTGPAHCAACHGAPDERDALAEGKEVPLTGGMAFHLPVGTFYTANLTSDRETGLGRYRDEEIARILRFSVHANGQQVLPFMPFANLSDEDLTAIISYLRTLPSVRNEVPKHAPNLVGRLVKSFVLTPKGPTQPIVAKVPRGPTVEYGHYLAHNVAHCVGCHTKMDMKTGAPAGPIFSGGGIHPGRTDPNVKFSTPNLTPDKTSGWIVGWSEDAFVQRIGAGAVNWQSPMPWEAFKHLTEDDRRAIFRYLQTVPAAPGGPDPIKRDTVVSAN
jgi:mono/diheme cytochrome c family protein